MKWIISDHAIDRYCQRIDPTVSSTDARSYLECAASRAVLQRQKTRACDLRYAVDDVILIARRDHGGNGMVVCTVVPAQQKMQLGYLADEFLPSANRSDRSEAADLIGEHAVAALEASGFVVSRPVQAPAAAPSPKAQVVKVEGVVVHVQGNGFALARVDDRSWVFSSGDTRVKLVTRAKRGAVDAVLVGDQRQKAGQ